MNVPMSLYIEVNGHHETKGTHEQGTNTEHQSEQCVHHLHKIDKFS